MSSTVELLKSAKDVILQYGWVQGTQGDRESGFCATGAIWEAAGYRVPSGLSDVARWQVLVEAQAAESVLFDVLRNLLIGPRVFNDTIGRTKEEVLALFDTAIARAETKESV
jgi:hypothetical protein